MVRPADTRRLVLIVAAIVFVDTAFYAVVAPLLPTLARQLHLSRLSAGVLSAGYPAGVLVGALPAGLLVGRVGPRAVVYGGLGLMASASVAFAFAGNVVLLDLARLVQGLGGACSWAGGLVWLVAGIDSDNRGARIGAAIGAAVGGALFGPAVGTLAQQVGRPVVFSSVGLVAAGLVALTRGLPLPEITEDAGIHGIGHAVRRPAVSMAMWLVGLPALASGVLNVLVPLRLNQFGASGIAIGAAFLIASGLEAVVSPIAGRLSDRHGRMAPLRAGLAGTTVLIVCVTLPHTALALALVFIAAAVSLGVFWAPAMAMLSDAATIEGVSQGVAFGLVNLAWAGGQIVGSAGGGGLAKAVGDIAPLLAVAAVCAITLALVLRASWRTRATAPSSDAATRAQPSPALADRDRA